MLTGSLARSHRGGGMSRTGGPSYSPAWCQPLEQLLRNRAEPPLCSMAAFDSSSPQRFYLPAEELAGLADWCAPVDGARMPLHSQLLTAQSAVLRGALLGQAEGACCNSGTAVEVSAGAGELDSG